MKKIIFAVISVVFFSLFVFSTYATGNPYSSIDFDTIYAGHNNDGYFADICPPEDLYISGFYILSDNESRGLLDSVNCGALSYGRIGEERVIDTEKHSLAVISIFFPYNPENLIEKTELSEIIIKNGNVTVTVSEDYGMTGGIESITVFRFIVILEKEDLVTLNSDSKYFLNFDYLLFYEAEDTFSMNTVNNFFDLTADGVFDTKDLTRLMRVLAGDEEATAAQSADINGDGAFDTKDLTRMMKYLAGGNE